MSARYVVTGCAGFIAARVVQLLLEAGHSVVGIDNLNDAYDPRLKHWRLAQLEAHAGFTFHRLDIADLPALRQVFERLASVDGVLNLAARAGVRASVTQPWDYLNTNVTGTLNLLEICRQHPVHKFVLSSTSSLYAGSSRLPFHEEDPANRPLSPYAASKKAAEAIAFAYHHLHGIDIAVPRYFTVYGPWGRPDMSIFRFIRNVAEGEPLTVFGDGTQERDFTYVDDVARGTIACLGVSGYEVINLGGSQTASLLDVIQRISQLVQREAQIQFAPFHRADMVRTWADNAKAKRLLGWTPQVTLQEGLRRSVDWYREHRQQALTIRLGD